MSVILLELLIAALNRGLPFITSMKAVADRAKAEGRTELTDQEINLLLAGATDEIDDYLAGSANDPGS